MTKKLIASGCSFTAGNGWADMAPSDSIKLEVKDSPNLWVNLCHNRIKRLNTLELINVGQCGASNTEIFQNTLRTMCSYGNQIDTIFCQWTAMPRYNWNVGFELWNTSEGIEPGPFLRQDSVNLNCGDVWPREYINEVIDKLRAMHHLHWEILKVVDYSHMISSLAKKAGILNVFFINGICPWDNEYFVKLENAMPESYTEFTKTSILNISTRDDQDIFKLYNLAHDHYQQAGGVDASKWINLYDSFLKNKIDTNFDKCHPGVKSNELYYTIIRNRLEALGFI